MILKNKNDLEQVRQAARKEMEAFDCRILVCSGTGCVASGAEKIYQTFQDIVKDAPGVTLEFAPHDEKEHVGIKKTGCQGFCELGPLVRIQKGDNVIQYIKVQPDDCADIFEKSVRRDEVIEELLYKQKEKVYRHPDEIPFIAKQTRVVLENCGKYDAVSLNEYIASGGFSAFARALFEMKPEDVVEEIDKSGLRGRGGGGFPTGRKWKQVAGQAEQTRYVVCNGDEGDPGAFMDGSVMEGDPYKLLEGMMIAGYAVSSQEGYIYVRAEYPLSVARLRYAISELESCGLLGDNILGSDFSFHMHINRGAGAFVCGEGSALTASIEGNRGMPRTKPPRTVDQGLWAKPTVLNNVETYANVPKIVLNGADWFRTIGSEKSPGTKTFSITGAIENTGLIEVPMGSTLREIIYDIGGGVKDGAEFKGVQIGGPSGGCLTKEHLDVGLDFDSVKKYNAIVGSGGLVVMDENTCMVEVARFFMSFTQRESCGKCTPCRIGTKRMLEILERIVEGKGKMEDLDRLEEIADFVKTNSLCGLGKSAPLPVISTLKTFRDEYVEHIVDKKCKSHTCQAMKVYRIDAEKCIGCTKCAKNCPAGAITGEKKKAHTIDMTKCIRCGACVEGCNFDAVCVE
ncbi:NADH-ubiquinone oxidoreductase-F iron-sulfur binding region domain-containing protein [Ruminococcus gauvreauii]|uniref:4Fe-4S binding protein n=1 Tax=Ruminococcus gauvreauii TaxID=438033 RepID=A0ABY5VHP7_9FIRM|nr:NADH-ubiquinone oxidoreductase-F iron-sulfur binding region domain-containing protein [Ruminococcus gauvreauii]UWP59756.1 4Fe-4S binding protein [Ruminococcus gauvreauii]